MSLVGNPGGAQANGGSISGAYLALSPSGEGLSVLWRTGEVSMCCADLIEGAMAGAKLRSR
jgi:hypothetical protein